jgi:hypothetical protein
VNNDPLAFLGAAAQFPPSSRYHRIEIVRLVAVGGRTVAYLRRRFVPPPESMAALQEHRVVDGERLDHLAARYLGDPEQYWRICDANSSFVPADLTEVPGRTLRIALPAGFPAPPPHA